MQQILVSIAGFDSHPLLEQLFYRLKMVDEAQREEKEYLAVWAAEKRREDAEKAFRKWMNKKHSVLLKEAETELEEAKQKREDTEKKMKIRRAMLRAKVLCKLNFEQNIVKKW